MGGVDGGCDGQGAVWTASAIARPWLPLPLPPSPHPCACTTSPLTSDLNLEFEVPFRELGFHGVPHRTNSFIMPTVNCLVELTEMPFTVLTLSGEAGQRQAGAGVGGRCRRAGRSAGWVLPRTPPCSADASRFSHAPL